MLVGGTALLVFAGIRVARSAAEELTSDDEPAELAVPAVPLT
jgi:hypothetical protein